MGWQDEAEDLKGEVFLEITGGQGEITTACKADCYYRNGSFYLLFEENLSEDGEPGQFSFRSRLKISEDKVSLKRSTMPVEGREAQTVLEMQYQKQKEGECGQKISYPTPFGVLALEVFTKELQVRLREKELTADISYILMQEGQEASQDRIQIRVWKEKA